MDFTLAISVRRRGKKTAYLARLMYRDRKSGQRKEKSKSAGSRSEAKRLLRELEDEFTMGGQTTVESHDMTFAALAKHCKEVRYCEAQYDEAGNKLFGVRDATVYEAHFKHFEDYFGMMKLRDIKVAHLRGFRKLRLSTKTKSGKYLNVATVNREMSTLKAALNEAVVSDWLIVNPFSKAPRGELISTADETKRETILTVTEEARLLAACEGKDRRHLKALVIAALDTGARQGELLNLRWSNIDFSEGIIRDVINYKGRKGTLQRRDVPLTSRLKAALLDLRETKPIKTFRRLRSGAKPSDALIFGVTDNVKRSWTGARKEAGLLHVRFHDLRHTAATRLAQSNMPLVFVGKVLGHSDPKTTNRYVSHTRQTIIDATAILESWQQHDQQPLIEVDSVS